MVDDGDFYTMMLMQDNEILYQILSPFEVMNYNKKRIKIFKISGLNEIK